MFLCGFLQDKVLAVIQKSLCNSYKTINSVFYIKKIYTVLPISFEYRFLNSILLIGHHLKQTVHQSSCPYRYCF